MASQKPSGARAPEAPEAQDQSIKARKSSLFEVKTGPASVNRPFGEYVREAAPAPLTPTMKAILGALAAVVALLFLASLLNSFRAKPSRRPRASELHKSYICRYHNIVHISIVRGFSANHG